MNRMTEYERVNAYYMPAIDEDGWQISGEPLGFRPDLDRALIQGKVYSILLTLHDFRIVNVPDADQGDRIVQEVVDRCRTEEAYDQYSIARFIFESTTLGAGAHRERWRAKARAVLGLENASED